MNTIRAAYSAAILSLLFTVAAYTQPLPQDEPKPHEPAQTQQQPEEKPEKQKAEKDHQEKEKPAQKEPDTKAESPREQKGHSAQANAGGKGGHIPDDKFRASFGKNHTFTINRPTIVNNQPTFQYGGYSFQIVDPWPVGWAYTDNCYIDYIDGEYFLFDVFHPGVQIALFVVM